MNVIDLMAALEASVADMSPAAPGPARTARRRGAAAGRRRAAFGPRPPRPAPDDLDALSKADLQARAAELDIPGRLSVQAGALLQGRAGGGRPNGAPEKCIGIRPPARPGGLRVLRPAVSS